MSTTSVKNGLVSASQLIYNIRQTMTTAKTRVTSAIAEITAIPTTYSDIISEINGYTPTGAFETLCKNELTRFVSEYQALKTEMESLETFMSTLTEF